MEQKGFIQIPLLIITVASIVALSIGTSVALYRQQKTPSFTANISGIIYSAIYEKDFEIEKLKQETELSKIEKERAEKYAQEEIVKRTEAETAKEEAEVAKKEAEQIAEEETIKRTHEEATRKAVEQELSEKEAEEERLSADKDGDGLVLREEEKLGTSDSNRDSDNDGINDKEDLHPAGGGIYLPQNFNWEYEGKSWTWTYSIHEDRYEYYKNKPRVPQGSGYITSDDPFIQEIAKALKKNAEQEDYHLSSFIVSFIQGLPYVEDYYTSFDEYPKYPIETFVSRNGDCEDTSYLFASIVRAAEIGIALVQFHDHMGVGVKTVHEQSGYYYPIDDDWYYYYETTGKGWQIGELPSEYKSEKAKIIRPWESEGQYVYPKYKEEPCRASTLFSGYYTREEKNYYRDSQCWNLVSCLYYSGFYYNLNTESFYHDSNCTQIITKGCYKSESYPGKFYKSGNAWYYDSQCIQQYKSMLCDYPYSYGYTCTSEYQYTSKQSSCGSIRALCSSSGTLGSPMCGYATCLEELNKCRSDIDEYQRKYNEYNQCFDKKEY